MRTGIERLQDYFSDKYDYDYTYTHHADPYEKNIHNFKLFNQDIEINICHNTVRIKYISSEMDYYVGTDVQFDEVNNVIDAMIRDHQ